MSTEAIDVVAGVLRDDAGRVLLAQRPAGKDHAGLWEFPGGKVDPGETPLAALARELLEELGIELHDAQPLVAVRHDYPGKAIRLHAWQVQRWTGEPQSLDGQSLAWVPVAELDGWPMPAADRPIVVALRLPSRYAITPDPAAFGIDDFCARFERLVAGGVRLVQLRSKQLDDAALRTCAQRCARVAERHGADLLINDRPMLAFELGVGLHLPSACLREPLDDASFEPWLPRDADVGFGVGSDANTAAHSTAPATTPARASRQARGWLAASCHDLAELDRAARLGCDFATLSPVQRTTSHAGSPTLGWRAFASLVAQAALPVYALGGMAARDEVPARGHGARGIAAISAFWPGGS